MSASLQATVKAAPSRDLWSVQYLRAFAAIAVVIFHQLGTYGVFKLGTHGVDLFFVISGFIMVALTENRHVTFKLFILDRVARIGPPYWVATGLVFLLALCHVQIFGESSDPLLFIKSLLFIPSFNGGDHVWPTLYLGWTLNYEMFFYIVFAIGLTITQRSRMLFLTLVFVSLIAFGAIMVPKDPILLTYTNPRIAEFLSGAWLGAIFGVNLDKRSLPMAASASLAVAAILAAASIKLPELIYGTGSVLILAAGLILERLKFVPKTRLLKTIGDASFAIYLFQGFAFFVVDEVCQGLDTLAGLDLQGHGWVRLVRIVAALGLGYGVFRVVEKPLTRSVRQWLRGFMGAPVRIREAA